MASGSWSIMTGTSIVLESMGYATGIDLEALLAVRHQVATLLPEEEWYGFTASAGLPKHFDTATLGEAP